MSDLPHQLFLVNRHTEQWNINEGDLCTLGWFTHVKLQTEKVKWCTCDRAFQTQDCHLHNGTDAARNSHATVSSLIEKSERGPYQLLKNVNKAKKANLTKMLKKPKLTKAMKDLVSPLNDLEDEIKEGGEAWVDDFVICHVSYCMKKSKKQRKTSLYELLNALIWNILLKGENEQRITGKDGKRYGNNTSFECRCWHRC